MSEENKIRYRNSYGFGGEQLRSFDVFGFTVAEEIGIEKKDSKTMILISDKKNAQLIVHLNNLIPNITVDQFINEFNRLRNLPNTGKNLYHKN